MTTESVAWEPGSPQSGLTGGQKWMIAGLMALQIPSSLIFFPLAAIFAITGIFVPIALALMGIGTLPVSYAMKSRDRWQGVGVAGGVGAAPVNPILPPPEPASVEGHP